MLSFPGTPLSAADNYHYFTEAQSYSGPTGNIETPSTKVTPRGSWSFGLHRYVVGVDYGAFDGLEAGINFDLEGMSALFPLNGENLRRKNEEISFHSKYRLLREEEHPLDVSLGQRRNRWYLATGKRFPVWWDLSIEGGVSWERNELKPFFAVGQAGATEQVLIDYDPFQNHYNIGGRFLLSPEMKLDLFIIDCTHVTNLFFDNFVFGLTISGG